MEFCACSELDYALETKGLGDLEKAESLLTAAIKQVDIYDITSDNRCKACDVGKLYNERGHVRYLMVNFNEAVDDYTKAIKFDPHLEVAYYNRGQIHYRMGRFQHAVQDLQKTVSLDSNFKDAKLALKSAKEQL